MKPTDERSMLKRIRELEIKVDKIDPKSIGTEKPIKDILKMKKDIKSIREDIGNLQSAQQEFDSLIKQQSE